MNYTLLFHKGDLLLCKCGQTATVPARGMLPPGWIVKQVQIQTDVFIQAVCPACDQEELEKLNP